MRTAWRTKLVAVAAALVVALLAACGGGDDDDNPSTTAQPTTTGTATATNAGNDATATEEPDDEETATATPDDGGNGGDGELNACELLTNEEIEAVVGTGVADGEAIDADPLHNCRWADEGYFVDLSVIFTDPVQAADYYEGTGGETEEEIDGIGEKAKYTIDAEIVILEGSYTVAMSVYSITFAESALEPSKDLASKVVDRLP
jgi:hypothetical protein